jgi:hypothetical protein
MFESKQMHTDFVLRRCVYATTRAKFEVCGKLLGIFGHSCRRLPVLSQLGHFKLQRVKFPALLTNTASY